MSAYNNPTSKNTSYNRRKNIQTNALDEWLALLLYYIIPFVLFNGILFFCVTSQPKCTITVGDTNDYLSTEVTMTIDSWFPTKSVMLAMDSEEIQMEKVGRTYKAEILKNGTLEVKIVNLNGMPLTQFEHVSVLDDTPPLIQDEKVEDGFVTMRFFDSQSGINLDSIYAENSLGETQSPLELDQANAIATFMMDSAGLDVYAQDKAGLTVHGKFTSHKEGEKEVLQSDQESEADEGNAAADDAL